MADVGSATSTMVTTTKETSTKETNYREIENYLISKQYPAYITGDRSKKANFRRTAQRFVMVDGRLHFKNREIKKLKDVPEFSLAVQDCAARFEYIRGAHEGLGTSVEARSLGGHLGRDKTLDKLIQSGFWWPNMNVDVRKYVATCTQCQKGSTRFAKVAAELHTIPVPNKVWHQVGVDLCSLKVTPDGFVGICVVADYFSKWVEAKPIKSKSSVEVATFLYELICCYGCPSIQINDQGREFCNKVCDKLFELTGTKQRVTSAYHPQSNGLVERANHTIQGCLL